MQVQVFVEKKKVPVKKEERIWTLQNWKHTNSIFL